MAIHTTNRLLNALPQDYRNTLLARMEEVDLPIPKPLYEPNETPRYGHFLNAGIASVVTFMQNGSGVEVGLIGSEGLVEATHLLGSTAIHTTGFMQVVGRGFRLPFSELRAEFTKSETLRTCTLQFVQAQSLMLSQIAACNRLHEVEERMARWLLMVADRTGGNEFYITQEFLAEMIGAQRTTVTVVAGTLQKSGLIEYRRGRLRILDRENLEKAACECYPIVRDVVSALYT